jgi:hypothetical protein
VLFCAVMLQCSMDLIVRISADRSSVLLQCSKD